MPEEICVGTPFRQNLHPKTSVMVLATMAQPCKRNITVMNLVVIEVTLPDVIWPTTKEVLTGRID